MSGGDFISLSASSMEYDSISIFKTLRTGEHDVDKNGETPFLSSCESKRPLKKTTHEKYGHFC